MLMQAVGVGVTGLYAMEASPVSWKLTLRRITRLTKARELQRRNHLTTRFKKEEKRLYGKLAWGFPHLEIRSTS